MYRETITIIVSITGLPKGRMWLLYFYLLLMLGYCQALPAFGAAAGQNISARAGAHPGAKAVNFLSFSCFGLVGALHIDSRWSLADWYAELALTTHLSASLSAAAVTPRFFSVLIFFANYSENLHFGQENHSFIIPIEQLTVFPQDINSLFNFSLIYKVLLVIYMLITPW